jgi:trans-aconitate 2-methyltransferase
VVGKAPREVTGLTFQKAMIEEFRGWMDWDLVLSNAAIQHTVNHKELFGRIRGALKTGGQLAIQMPANHDYPTHVLADRISREVPFRDWLRSEVRPQSVDSGETYARWLHDLGFRETKVLTRVYGHVLPDRSSVIEWIRGTLLTWYESRLTADQYKGFVEELRRRLWLALPDERPFFYPFKRIFIWGRL